MTDKEQIIIDEIDVGGCEFMIPTVTTPKCESNDNIHCDGREDNVCKDGCYYSLIPIFKDIINKAKEANND